MVGASLRQSPKSSSAARGQYLDRRPLSQHSLVMTSEQEAVFSKATLVSALEYVTLVYMYNKKSEEI